MNFEELMNRIIKDLSQVYRNLEFSIIKDQRHGECLTIKNLKKDANFNIVLSGAKQDHEGGAPYKEILEEFVKIIEEQKGVNADISFLNDYNKVKDHLILDLVRYTEDIRTICHTRLQDMAIVYKVHVESENGGTMIGTPPSGYFEFLGIPKSKLHIDATLSSMKLLPIEIRQVDDAIWYVTNKNEEMGSSVLAYPNFFDTVYEKLKSPFYLLPFPDGNLVFPDYVTVDFVKSKQTEESISDNIYHFASSTDLSVV